MSVLPDNYTAGIVRNTQQLYVDLEISKTPKLCHMEETTQKSEDVFALNTYDQHMLRSKHVRASFFLKEGLVEQTYLMEPGMGMKNSRKTIQIEHV